MRSVAKIFGITLAVLFGLLVLVVAAINIVPGNQYKGLISTLVEAASGRELVIGDLDVELGSRLRVAASDVTLQMFSGRLIEGEVPLQPLLSGILDVRLVLEAPDLLLERDADGRGNWQLGASQPEEAAESDLSDQSGGIPLRPLLREVRLEQARLAFVETPADQRHEAEFETVLIRSQGDEVQVKLEGRLDEHKLALAGGLSESAVTDASAPAEFTLTGKLGDIGLSVRGKLDAISATARADLLLEADVPSLAALSVLAGRDLPDQGPLKASLRLSGAEGRYGARDIKLDLGAELLKAVVEGTVADLAGMSGIDLVVSAKTDRLTELVQQLGLESPGELPPGLDAEGKVQGSLKELALGDYRVRLRDQGVEVSVKGQVENVTVPTGIKADVVLEAQSLTALSKYAATELPDSGPVQISGTLTSPNGLDAASQISVVLSADGVAAKAGGSVENLLTAQGISLTVDVAGESLEQVGKLVGQDLARKEPLDVKTQLHLGGTTYKAEKLSVRLGKNEVSGDLAFTRSARQGEPARLEGQLHLGKLDLEALAGTGETRPAPPDATAGAVGDRGTEATAKAATDGNGKKTNKVFPSDPLPLEVLRSLDMDLDITADELGTETLLLDNLIAKLTLNKGVLKLAPVNARVGEGTFKANSVLDASKSPATLAMVVDLGGGTSRHFGGRYSLDADLDASGDSVAQMMAGLDGQLILDVRDMELDKSFMTNFGQGLLNTIDPFDKEAGKTRLVCAIVRFDIAEGIADADDKMVAQLTNVTWFGGGRINLKTEAVDFGAQSKARSGLGVANLGTLPSLVHIGGTLADPKVVPNPKGMAKTYGQAYLTVATGGLYWLIKGLWDKQQADSDVCAEMLAKRETEKGTPTGAEVESDAAAGVTPADTPPAPAASEETGFPLKD